jgi:hypothetical protein
MSVCIESKRPSSEEACFSESIASVVKLAEFEERSFSSLVEEFIQNALEHEVDMRMKEIRRWRSP